VKGLLVAGVVPTLFRSIYRGRRTGVLRFIREDECRRVRFMSGHIVHGEASVEELRLGEVLVAARRLDPAVLAHAVEVMQRERKRLGAVLTEMGLLDEKGLEEALALHLRAILTSVFALRDGAYTFQEQDPETFPEGGWPLAISTGEAVLAAVRALRVRDDVRFALGDLDRVLLASDDPLVLYQRMDLGPEDAFLLSRIDGTRSAREALIAARLPAPSAERSLLALLCTGLVEYTADGPRPAETISADQVRREVLELHGSLARRSDHEVLGVPRGASASDLKAAYFRLARRYHPDVMHEPGLADLRDELEAVFFRLHDAYRALSARSAMGTSPERDALGAAPSPADGAHGLARRA
jgi:hypothetical protein